MQRVGRERRGDGGWMEGGKEPKERERMGEVSEPRLPRGLGGPRANTKSEAPQNGLWEGGLGAWPQEILKFYML